MEIDGTLIEESFAEAFGMRFARILITAHDDYWLEQAAREFTGFAASIIACDVEAGIERRLDPDESPDGRVGCATLLFGTSAEKLAKAVATRTGQCLMTCASSAVYDGLPDAADRHPLGNFLRYFGDGFQKSKVIADRRYWRIPVMDGEFLVEDTLGIAKGVAGGALIFQSQTEEVGLAAVRRANAALDQMPGVVAPFPGAVARSGSKVGSRYAGLHASTNEAYCPSLRGLVSSQLHDEAQYAYEIVIDGISQDAVAEAMAGAARAAAGGGLIAISAANYGGNLGKYHFSLHEILN